MTKSIPSSGMPPSIKSFSYGRFKAGDFKLFKYYDSVKKEVWKVSEVNLKQEIEDKK